ncbi:hypothetical protein Esti_002252 [Eimeria stiedai]
MVLRAVDLEGTEEQKKHYLPKLCSDTVGSFCLSEAGSGSDAFSLGTLATRDEEGGGWVINGCKQWISNSEEAGLFLVFATIDPQKEHKGICCFLVDSNAEGLTIGRRCDKLGIRASSTCEVKLSNVFVPDNRVLGRLREGYKVANTVINESRIGTAALMLGLARGAFDVAIPFLSDREQFGHKLVDFQGVRFQAAELATEIEAARLMVLNAGALKAAGLPFIKEAAMAKYKASRVAEKVASQCIDFLGGRGYTREYPFEKSPCSALLPKIPIITLQTCWLQIWKAQLNVSSAAQARLREASRHSRVLLVASFLMLTLPSNWKGNYLLKYHVSSEGDEKADGSL